MSMREGTFWHKVGAAMGLIGVVGGAGGEVGCATARGRGDLSPKISVTEEDREMTVVEDPAHEIARLEEENRVLQDAIYSFDERLLEQDGVENGLSPEVAEKIRTTMALKEDQKAKNIARILKLKEAVGR